MQQRGESRSPRHCRKIVERGGVAAQRAWGRRWRAARQTRARGGGPAHEAEAMQRIQAYMSELEAGKFVGQVPPRVGGGAGALLRLVRARLAQAPPPSDSAAVASLARQAGHLELGTAGLSRQLETFLSRCPSRFVCQHLPRLLCKQMSLYCEARRHRHLHRHLHRHRHHLHRHNLHRRRHRPACAPAPGGAASGAPRRCLRRWWARRTWRPTSSSSTRTAPPPPPPPSPTCRRAPSCSPRPPRPLSALSSPSPTPTPSARPHRYTWWQGADTTPVEVPRERLFMQLLESASRRA